MTDIRDRLRQGGPAFGLIQLVPVPTFTELFGWAGCDFVIIDCEHGLMEEAAQVEAIRAAALAGIVSLVRLRPGDDHGISRYLDWGADGIVVPDVRTAERAQAIAREASAGPGGGRNGTHGAHRAHRWGGGAPGSPPLLFLLLESREGTANAQEILAVAGIDGAIVGPHDLSGDLGAPGDYARPDYVAALVNVERAAQAAGKIVGSTPHGPYDASTLVARGHRLNSIAADAHLLRGAVVEALRRARTPHG